MGSNLNFLTPEIDVDFGNINTKSIPNYDKLNNQISQNYKVLKEQFEIFSGDFSAVYSLVQRLNLENCVIYSPAYLEYKKIALKFGYEVQLINRLETLNVDIQDNSFVIFTNPSFPDGKFYEIEELLLFWKGKNATVLIDESFLDFTNEKSASRFLVDFPNIYILKSMTKFYGNAGIQISLLISSTLNIKKIKEFEPNNKLSIFDVAYFSSALNDKLFKKVSKALMVKNNILLENILKNSQLFEIIYPSRVNFILAKLKIITACKFKKALEMNNILINDCSHFDFLDDKFIQISVNNEDDMRKLKEVLQTSKI